MLGVPGVRPPMRLPGIGAAAGLACTAIACAVIVALPAGAVAQDANDAATGGPGREADASEAASDPAESAVAPVAELVTDRPDVTESTSIVPAGWLQAELGLTHEDAAGTTLAVPGTLVRIGLSRRIEGRLGWGGWIDEDPADCVAGGDGRPSDCGADGAGDAEAGLKVLLVERSGARPDVAVLSAVSLPVGDEVFSSDGVDPSLLLLLGNDLSPVVAWGANAGLALVSPGDGVDGGRRTLASWSWSFGFAMTDRLGSFLEYFGEAPEDGPALHAVDAGFTFLLTPDVQLDASGGVGLAERAPDVFLGAGLTFRAGVFGR
jgi:hypothetical protein